jgi:hypothetical protein
MKGKGSASKRRVFFSLSKLLDIKQIEENLVVVFFFLFPFLGLFFHRHVPFMHKLERTLGVACICNFNVLRTSTILRTSTNISTDKVEIKDFCIIF